MLNVNGNLKFGGKYYVKAYKTLPSLPSGYTALTYIKGTGTQWIDTGVTGGQKVSFDIVADLKENEQVNGWGMYLSGRKYALCPRLMRDGNRLKVRVDQQASGKNYVFDTLNGVNEIKYEGSSLYLNGTLVYNEFAENDGWGNTSVYVFNSHAEPNLIAVMVLKHLTLGSDGYLVRDYYPCMCNIEATGYKGATAVTVPAGTKGLYDTVEGKFYVNCGTGADFIAGDTVETIYDNPSVAVNNTTKSITVPSSKLTDASVLSVGGKSMVVNQLVDTDTTSVTTVSGHKYYTNISSTESVITSDGTALAVTGGTDKVTDLTLAFGTDTPSSTSDSRITWLKTYLLSHPEYNAGSIVSADVSEVKSVGVNLFHSADSTTTRGTATATMSNNIMTYNNPDSTNKHRGMYITPTGLVAGIANYTGGELTDYNKAFVLPQGDVTVSFTSSSGIVFEGAIFSADTSVNIGTITNTDHCYFSNQTSGSKTFSVSGAKNCLNILIGSYTIGTATDIKIQIECGSTVTTWTPYFSDTLTIPQSVRNLEGYGVGLDASTYNYVDFGLRKFVKAVTSQNITGVVGDEIALVGCDTSATTYMCAKGDIGTLSNGTLTLTSDVTNVAVYYKLATAVETDISLPDTTIQTQAGGSITFENGNNLDVPSGVKYWNDYQTYLTVQCTTRDSVAVTGQTVTIHTGTTSSSPVFGTYTYSGTPLRIAYPKNSQYFVEVTDTLADHFNPTTASGTLTTDTTVTLTYSDMLHLQTFKDVKTAIDRGATNAIAGQEIADTWIDSTNTSYSDPMVVTSVETVQDADGVEHTAAIMVRKYASKEAIQFDAAEGVLATGTYEDGLTYFTKSGNTVTLLVKGTDYNVGDTITGTVYKCSIYDSTKNIYNYGYNRYRDSAYRQYLTSNAIAGNWWTATHIGDAPPAGLNSVRGYMAGCSAALLAAAKPIKITCYTNFVTDGSVVDVMVDKFWLPSGTQLYGSVNANEGTYWKYYKDKTGWDSPNNADNNGRIHYAVENHSSAQTVRLRSAVRGLSCDTWYCFTTGHLSGGGGYAGGPLRCVAACAIY